MSREKKPGMESVKIGGLAYTVKKVSDLQGKEGDWGRIQYKTQEITLDDSLKEQLEDQTEFPLDQNNQLWHIVDKMEEINSKNVKAINNRFDTVEADIKALKKTQKKSWFSRK